MSTLKKILAIFLEIAICNVLCSGVIIELESKTLY